jgi:hypothetical protein
MAEACTIASLGQLAWVAGWYIRKETYAQALRHLVDHQQRDSATVTARGNPIAAGSWSGWRQLHRPNPPGDYRERFEALTGRSLRQCPHCHTGTMVVIDSIMRPSVCRPVPDTSWPAKPGRRHLRREADPGHADPCAGFISPIACAFSSVPPVSKVGCDPRGAKCVAADLALHAGLGRATLNHSPGVNAIHWQFTTRPVAGIPSEFLSRGDTDSPSITIGRCTSL